MTRTARGLRTPASWALAALCLLGAPAAHAEYDLTPRPILSTGDQVPPLDRIGGSSAFGRGMDARGRLLVGAGLSDGTKALFWADGKRFEFLWRSGATEDQPLIYPDWSVASSGGTVIALGVPAGLNLPAGESRALYRVSPAPIVPIISIGDHTVDGATVGYLYEPAAVADDGTAVVLATVVDASGPQPQQAVLVVRDGRAEVVAGSSAALPAERRFSNVFAFGLTPTGAALFSTTRYATAPRFETERGVFAADPTSIRAVAVSGAPAPSGVPWGLVDGLSASPSGEVLFRGCEDRPLPTPEDDDDDDLARGALCGLYRTERGPIVRVARGDDRTPDGFRFAIERAALSDSGAVAVQASWLDESRREPYDDPLFSGVLLYRTNGESESIAVPAQQPFINAAGDVGLTGALGSGLSRWRGGRLQPIVDRDTVMPDGVRPIAGGLSGVSCLAEDGRVATFATFADGVAALLCIDGDGAHVIAPGEAWAGARQQCGFGAGEDVVFGGNNAIYRAAAHGIEAVVAAGDFTDRGHQVTGIDQYVAGFRNQYFAVNRAGTLVARVLSPAGPLLVRRRRGGPLEEVALDLAGGSAAIRSVIQAEIAADDSIVVLARLASDPVFPDHVATVVARFDASGGRIILDQEALNGAPESLWVRDMLAEFLIDHGAGSRLHYVKDLRSGVLRQILAPERYPELRSRPFVLDFSSTGDAVFFAYAWDDERQQQMNGRWLLDGDRVALLSSDYSAQESSTDPRALNTAGNILFEYLTDAFGGAQQRLGLSGAPVSGRCPVVDVALPTPTVPPHGHEDDGCQVVAANSASPWQLLLPPLLVLIRRRRL